MYDDIWHAVDFAVNLTADYPVTETYYRINGGAAQNVSASGLPVITSEGANNTLRTGAHGASTGQATWN
jgi:hypothetical protein